MKLDGKQFAQLEAALISAFPSEQRLRRMVRVRLGENLAVIATGQNLSDIIFELITWAESTGNLEKLVVEGQKANPNNSDLKAFAQNFIAGVSSHTASSETSYNSLHTSEPDTSPPHSGVIQLKLEELRKNKESYIEEYQAANEQLRNSLSAVDRTRIERQIKGLEQQIVYIDEEMNRLRASNIPTSSSGSTPAPPSSTVSLGSLRKQLNRFDDVELDTFCMDEFPGVYDKFTLGMRKDAKINLLIDLCRRQPEQKIKLISLLQQ